MIPAPFDYFRPQTLAEAVDLLVRQGEDAKILAGGHSLLPAMKLRLAQPKAIIDLGRVADLNYVRESDGKLLVGAMTTHQTIESSQLLVQHCPLLPQIASEIGDVQVRNRGTIGGSIAHADPAADWPAAILALDAEVEVVGPGSTRTIPAREFFVDLYQTALQPTEILREIRFPATAKSVAYSKFAQRASGFAIVGVAAVLDRKRKAVSLGITGVAGKPYRPDAVEEHLRDREWTQENLNASSSKAAEGIDPLGDIHASAEFRKHLAQVCTARALTLAVARLSA